MKVVHLQLFLRYTSVEKALGDVKISVTITDDGGCEYGGNDSIKKDFTIRYVDKQPPEIAILFPKDQSQQESIMMIKGTASDSITQIEHVELMIADDKTFYAYSFESYNMYTSNTEIWSEVYTIHDTWLLTVDDSILSNCQMYTITARAFDTVGNVSYTSVTFMNKPCETPLISCVISKDIVTWGDTILISGEIIPWKNSHQKEIELFFENDISEPEQKYTIVNVNDNGYYQYLLKTESFLTAGEWKIQARWKGDMDVRVFNGHSDIEYLKINRPLTEITVNPYPKTIKHGKTLSLTGKLVVKSDVPKNMEEQFVKINIFDKDDHIIEDYWVDLDVQGFYRKNN
ncbi:MAG: hypothetical protein OMM_05455 [Candidatus Magnetoglobus multicellularis str. Araruama]|uniref:Uncharacterized protein n=1 Tax=Candidatus Magnetoglobus multicellularis str. Araruama TaxID=890399 RepID=A0A1V1NW76_9BACT|nr:MAG: hypothetical protein OMM_05455 [Candidatus Magnetoglobus multicellularis str. Araruama]